jgi:hypothetical protein
MWQILLWHIGTSPTGDAIGRAKAAANHNGRRNMGQARTDAQQSGQFSGPQRTSYHPYHRSYPKKKKN